VRLFGFRLSSPVTQAQSTAYTVDVHIAMVITATKIPTILFWSTVKSLKDDKLIENFAATGNVFHKLAAFRKNELKRKLFSIKGIWISVTKQVGLPWQIFNRFWGEGWMPNLQTFLRWEVGGLITTYQTLPYSSKVEFAFYFYYWVLQNKLLSKQRH